MKRLLWGLLGVVVLAVVAFFIFAPGYLERGINQVAPHEPYAISDRAAALHETLRIVDLHSDTLLWARDPLERATRGHVDIPRLADGNVALQIFPAVTKVPEGLNYDSNTADTDQITMAAIVQLWPIRTWGDLLERALYKSERLHDAASRAPEALMVVKSGADLDALIVARAKGANVVGGLLAIEGAHPLGGNLANIDVLYDAGFRMIGLHHFFDNELGGSLHGISQAGLTDFGKAAVRKMETRGIIVDLAHSSPAVVDDVLALATRPLVVSHTGVKGACDSARNLEDAQMKRIAAQGGLIGIGYWDGAVCDATPAGVARSIRYAIDLLGVDHVALGSDYDGGTTVYFDTSELAALTEAMLAEGLSEAEIRAVSGENALRFLRKNLPPS